MYIHCVHGATDRLFLVQSFPTSSSNVAIYFARDM